MQIAYIGLHSAVEVQYSQGGLVRGYTTYQAQQLFCPAKKKVVVVSTDLFWVFFITFSYNGVYLQPTHIFLPYPFPHTHFKRAKYSFICSNTMFLHDLHSHFQTVIILSFSIVWFCLTMTSQIESFRSTQYTPLYKKGIKEQLISQWRLLWSIIVQCPKILAEDIIVKS